MIETENIDRALKLDSLGLPEKPRIAKLDWDRYEDSAGDESLEIFVVLGDETTDQDIEQAPIHAIKRTIMDSLQEQGVDSFPYFFFERESEHESPSREEM